MDLHLLRQVEQAGTSRTEEPERLLLIIETMMVARQICRDGLIDEAMRLYDLVSLNPERVGMLR